MTAMSQITCNLFQGGGILQKKWAQKEAIFSYEKRCEENCQEKDRTHIRQLKVQAQTPVLLIHQNSLIPARN